MKDILKHIDSLKAAFEKLQPLTAENQQKLDKKFRLEWNYNSNHIEGNTLTYGETELLLIFDITQGNHEFREYEEMKGHDIALKLIEGLVYDKERGLTEKFIRELNEIILVRPFYKEAVTPDNQPTHRLIDIGKYKSYPNNVRLQNSEVFRFASVEETPALMGDLMKWYNDVKDKEHPIVTAALLHYKFVRIHPFDDGNGRISRLLMNYHLLKNNYPPVIVKTADKKNYIKALRKADAGNFDAFKEYIAEQLVWSCEISIKAAKGENIDEAGDWEKKIELLKKEVQRRPEATKEKSLETTREILINSIKPLLLNLLEKIKPLEEFYQKSDFYFIQDNKSITDISFEDAFGLIYSSNDEIGNLQFSHSLRNFIKNGTDTFSSYYTITFYFENLTYSLKIDNESSVFVKKLNNDYFTNEETDLVIKNITEKIYDQIQQRIKSK